MKKKILALFATLLLGSALAIGLTACGDEENSGGTKPGDTDPAGSKGLTYTVNADGETCKITGMGACNDTELTIPSRIDGYTVTGIERFAFDGCSELTRVTLPDSITDVGKMAFRYCDRLQYTVYENANYLGNENNPYLVLVGALDEEIASCTIHADTKVIGGYALFSCDNLTDVVIPEGVVTLGEMSFYDCGSLRNVTLPDSLQNIGLQIFGDCDDLQYNTYDGVMYMGNENNPYLMLAAVMDGSYTSYTVNERTKFISWSAFIMQRELKSVTIPASVRGIDSTALVVGGSLQEIKVAEDNPYFKSVNGSLYSKDGKELKRYLSDGTETAFSIPSDVRGIGEAAFFDSVSLTEINIPDGVTSIEEQAFARCSQLSDIKGFKNVTRIGERAFYSCEGLTDLSFCKKVIAIGEAAFVFCDGLTDITLNDGLTTIGPGAFSSCENLKTVSLPASVKKMGRSPFLNESLEEIKVAEGNACFCSIDGSLYTKDGKTLLQYAVAKEDTACTLPSGVTVIGENAFRWAKNLVEVVLPKGLHNIGVNAFMECTNLSSIEIPDGAVKIDDYAFYECESLTSVSLPDSVTEIGSTTFYNCGLRSVSLGSGLKTIGEWAFTNCPLENVYYNGTRADWEKVVVGDVNDSLHYATFHFNGEG